jgi:23S rRNA pseudouridine2604 synthase
MSERNICSRREADRFIEQGEVLVNGEVVSLLGSRVSPDVKIELLGKKSNVTILLNKPIGYVSNLPEKGYPEAIELITPQTKVHYDKGKLLPSHFEKLSVAGRLDIDSKGLLVLTQDGVIVKQLIGPDSDMEKEYLVRVQGTIQPEMLQQLRFGLSLDDKPLKPAKVDEIQPNLLRIILKEGKKRQIRRMCALVHLDVIGLKRVRIGKVVLGDLPEGAWRFLRPNERF